MSKDRLEEIKDKVSLLKNSSELQPHEFLVDILHLDWLIQQTEEKIQLEERFETLSNIHDQTLAENQRYKQALEFYADPENHDREVDYGKDSGLKKSNVDIDRGYKARQAIKGGNENE